MSVNLLSLAQQYLGGGVMDQIGKAIGADPAQTKAAVSGAVPSILAGLINKASTPGGADALAAAVDQTDTGMLDNLGGMLSGGGLTNMIQKGSQLGSSLLGGNMFSGIIDAITKSSGIGKAGIGSLLGMLMPIVLGILGKQKKSMGLDAAGLASMLMGQKSMVQGLLPQGVGNMLGMGGDVARAAGAAVSGAAGQAMSGVSHAAGAAGHAAQSGGSMLGKLLPLIIVAALAYLGYNYFMKGDAAKTVTDATRTATDAAGAAAKSAGDAAKSATDAAKATIDAALSSAASGLPKTFDSLTTTLSGIKDAATAKAAMPAITTASDSIGKVADGFKMLPESIQKTVKDSATGFLPKVQEMVTKVLGMEGIGAELKPLLDGLIEKIKKLIG